MSKEGREGGGIFACLHVGKQRAGIGTSKNGTIPPMKRQVDRFTQELAFPEWMGSMRNRRMTNQVLRWP